MDRTPDDGKVTYLEHSKQHPFHVAAENDALKNADAALKANSAEAWTVEEMLLKVGELVRKGDVPNFAGAVLIIDKESERIHWYRSNLSSLEYWGLLARAISP